MEHVSAMMVVQYLRASLHHGAQHCSTDLRTFLDDPIVFSMVAMDAETRPALDKLFDQCERWEGPRAAFVAAVVMAGCVTGNGN
jgi:hypothetical protein